MPNSKLSRFFWVSAWACLSVWNAGCADKGYDRYVPAEASARTALETALTAWQEDQPFGTIRKGPVAVEVVDAQWRQGQKLESFEILHHEPHQVPPTFAVRLTLRGPAGSKEVRYVVAGRDPLWVYREEEFKRISGM